MVINTSQKAFFEENGYLAVENIIDADTLAQYDAIYQQFLDGAIDAGQNRSDLGVGLGNNGEKENITQIMWPSDFAPQLLQMPYFVRALDIARALLGNDIDMDFDMLIDKAPFTNTPTPWHQDAAYWISMPDKRAVSCWMAIDEATVDNGCMWYGPGSHKQALRPHRPAGKAGGALMCDADESEGVPVPLKPGSCVLHAGGTLHYSRGNTTGQHRRAYIINFRPAAMIALEREKGFDHGRSGGSADRKVRNTDQD